MDLLWQLHLSTKQTRPCKVAVVWICIFNIEYSFFHRIVLFLLCKVAAMWVYLSHLGVIAFF